MSDWDEFSAFSAVKEMVSQDPNLVHAVVRGLVAGQEENLRALREEMTWTNMALDMALTLTSGSRISQGTKDIAEHVIRKRLEEWGANVNGAERAFLARTALKEKNNG